MKRIGIGILSHAHGHVMAYSRVLQKMEGVELVAAWDDNEERGRAAADTYGYALRSSPAEVVDDPSIDAVIVTSETNRHAGHVELAAAAGKHILCQKPMATTLEDCDRIIAAVRRSGVKFSMAYQMRQDPVNQKIRELLAEGAVGKVAVVRRRHCIGVLLNPGFVNGPSRWHFDAEANVGMFFDDANHPADWYYWIFGRPTSVTATIDRIVSDIPTDDNGVAVYRFEGGVIGVLYNGSTTVAGVNTTEIDGDKGTLIQDYGDGPRPPPPAPPGPSPSVFCGAETASGPPSTCPYPPAREIASPPSLLPGSPTSAARPMCMSPPRRAASPWRWCSVPISLLRRAGG